MTAPHPNDAISPDAEPSDEGAAAPALVSTTQTSTAHASTTLPIVAMLGVGNMSGAVLDGLTRDGYGPATRIRVTNRSEASAAARRSARVTATALETSPSANADAVRGAGLVVLGVKPGMIGDLLDEIRDALEPGAVVVSVAAGVTLAALERRLPPTARVVRAMPNTPAKLGLGVTGIAAGAAADEQAMAYATALFEAVGEVVVVDEPGIDLVTGISGSGPAYVYLIVEELMRTAEALGLDADRARTLAVNTVRGAAAMLSAESDVSPGELRRRVTSPNGTTERAIAVLQEGGLGDLIERAVRANIARAHELAAEND